MSLQQSAFHVTRRSSWGLRPRTARRAVAFALSAALVATSVTVPAVAAYGDTESDLAAARAQLEEIGNRVSEINNELSSATDELNETDYQISEIQEQISQKETELDEAQQELSTRLSSDYKTGGGGLLNVLMGVDSLDQIVSRIFYMGKVANAEADAIDTVEQLKNELGAQQASLQATRAEQQQNVAALQTSVNDLNSQQAAAADVVNSLDAQLQQELAEEAARNAALKAAVEASQAPAVPAPAAAADTDTAANNDASTQSDASSSNASASSKPAQSTDNTQSTASKPSSNQSQSKPSTSAPTQTTTQTPAADPEPAPTPKPESKPQTTTESKPSSEPAYNASTGNAVVDRAYSKLGTAYVYGACSPNAFDCSGFVSYCLTGSYTRLGTTYTFMNWPRVSNPQPGDVCVRSSHTGIYIGNGQMIHASRPGVGVIIGPVQSGMIYVRRP